MTGRPRSRRRVGLLLAGAAVLALLVIGALLRHHGPSCHSRVPHGRGRAWLPEAIADVPCPGGGAVRYALVDDRGAPMDVLDPIADPSGGYLGVYHTPLGGSGAAAQHFEVLLGHSPDLVHWRRVAVLEDGASMATLRPVPGGPGYVLADERSGARDSVELHYYTSRAELLAAHASANVDLPLRFSRYSNGTPAIVQVAWHGALQRSVVTLAFHYQAADAGGGAGPDREAIGVLSGFRRWQARPDVAVDALLDAEGFPGNHGGQRIFSAVGETWRILEAQSQPGSFASWHVLLYDPASHRFEPVAFATTHGRFSASFGNPTAQVLPAPDGHGKVLVVTVFVFSSGPAAADAGELLYFRRLPS